jgi:hypothetical protein
MTTPTQPPEHVDEVFLEPKPIGEHQAVDDLAAEPPAPRPFPLTPIFDQLLAEQQTTQEHP